MPGAPAVDRVANGTPERGRYISHLSYAAYAEGAQLEALGHFGAALQAYERAMLYDPDSSEIWTRLGAVRCAMKRSDARAAFSKAENLAPKSASLWLAEARCELARGRPSRALELAKRSLEFDPNHAETTLLISEALRQQGREAEAHRWLVALAARQPGSRAAQLWLSRSAPKPETGPNASLRLVDAALLDGQAELANSRALELGLSEAELAAREIALGLTEQAFARANLVLRADPEDANAWVVLLVAADLLGKEAEFDQTVTSADVGVGPTDELCTLLLADLIKRRTGPAAARAWLEKAAPSSAVAAAAEPPSDPLTAQVRARLSAELAATTSP